MGIMVNINFLISLMFFSTLIIQGYCKCSAKDINIVTSVTGITLKGKSLWHVLIYNNCACPQSKIKISCKGFQSAKSVDPKIFSKIDGDNCLLINGNPLAPFVSVKFTYAWDPPITFLPISSVVSPCS